MLIIVIDNAAIINMIILSKLIIDSGRNYLIFDWYSCCSNIESVFGEEGCTKFLISIRRAIIAVRSKIERIRTAIIFL
jgi:hypothetical protein